MMAKTVAAIFFSSALMNALGNPVDFSSEEAHLYDCYESDKAYSGQVIMSHWAGCSRECQRRCEINMDCQFWTYNVEALGDNDCLLFSEGSLRESIGKISGPKRCGEPYHCALDEAMAGGNYESAFASEDSYHCHRKCVESPTCHYANFRKDIKECYLKGIGTLSDGSYHSLVIMTPRNCRQGWCFSYGQFHDCIESDKSIKIINGIPSAFKCQEQCRLNDACDFFSWNKDGDQKCYLRKRPCYNRKKIENATAVSGFKRCGTGKLCFDRGMDYFGGDVAATTANSAEACQDACFKNMKCTYFSWAPSSKMCWLKNDIGKANRTENEDRISGPAVCHDEPHCAKVNTQMRRHDLQSVSNVGTAKLCAKKCYETPGCLVFTYMPDNTCWLKSGLGMSNPNTYAGALSAPVGCYYNHDF